MPPSEKAQRGAVCAKLGELGQTLGFVGWVVGGCRAGFTAWPTEAGPTSRPYDMPSPLGAGGIAIGVACTHQTNIIPT